MEILSCPVCGGSGNRQGARCTACRGDGRLALFGEAVLFWGDTLSPSGIAERKIQLLLRRALFVFLTLIGLLGLGALFLESFRHPQATFFSTSFWRATSPRLLFFYCTLWTNAYLISRVLREGDRIKSVEQKTYGETAQSVLHTWEEAALVRGKRRRNIAHSFSPAATYALEEAYLFAHAAGAARVDALHLLSALLGTDDVDMVFARLGVVPDALAARLKGMVAAVPTSTDGLLALDDAFWQMLFSAYAIAFETHSRTVRPLELFLAVVRLSPVVQELLEDFGVDTKKVENVAAWVRIVAEIRMRSQRGRAIAASRPKGGMNRAMTAIATPALDSLSEDYTLRATHGFFPPFVNREKEMEAVFRIFEGGGRSVLLVGQPGTGKDAFLEGLAERMVSEDVPQVLQDKRLVILSLPKLIAGATPAEAAERLEQLFYEIAVSGNVILAIPAVEGLVGINTGSAGGIDLAEILETKIAKLGLLAIATTSPEAYLEGVERSAIGRGFEKVEFPEVAIDGAIQICEAKSGAIEAQQRVWFSYAAIESAVTLSDRYLHDRYLPEKAIEVMREVAYAVRNKRGERTFVTAEDVATLISEKAKVPVTSVTATERESLLQLESRMHGRVIGQDEAVSAVAAAIRRARTALRAENRPIANFLFLGPTGVGKTELAKTVAETYFGREEAMVRLDMSEYQDASAIHRLIGMPGGTAGGVLTDAVRRQPFTLLLLDEIEKAHPDLLNLFLQVMDDGRLTDHIGRTVDFTNVILIATSNAGSSFIQTALAQGKGIEEIKTALLNEQLQGIFRPEFLNRFDGVIVFRPLTMDDVEKIARLMLIGIAKQLEAKDIALQASDEAVLELATAGFDPVFGARPLRRVMQERVQDLLAHALLQGRITRRDVVVLEQGGTFRVERRVRS
jgi:ATP-dependent Clp protease ATP-binding subunit ClpC